VRVIRESTGVDLTRDLAPKPPERRLPPPPRR
jgi:hypothetical protein